MEYSVQLKVATISLWNYSAFLVNVIAFALLFLKANRNKALKTFFIVQGAMMIWLVGKVFKTVSPTEDLRWAFIVVYYFGVCLLEVSFFDFSYVYFKGEYLQKWRRIFLYGLGFCQFLVVLTNPLHYMFYSDYSFFGDSFGPLFYAHVVINYTLIIWGMIYCSRRLRHHSKRKKILKRLLISIAILIPIIFNLIYISGALGKIFRLLGIQVFDITPLVFTWSLLVFVYATFRYAFFDLTPLMKHEIINHLDTPILVAGGFGEKLFSNEAMSESMVDIEATQICKIIEADQPITIKLAKGYFRCQSVEVKHLFVRYHLLAFNDITLVKEGQLMLEEKKDSLEVNRDRLEKQIDMLRAISHAGAGNYVARELHDIVGHGLVVSMRLLEVCKLYRKKDPGRGSDSLQKAREVLDLSMDQMKSVGDKGFGDQDMVNYSILLDDLKKMLRAVEVSGMKVNHYFKGGRDQVDGLLYDILKKVTTELVTNTLKHGEATSILLSINTSESAITMNYMDNGIGTDDLIKGNGLEGIESRLALKGGRMKVMTEAGQGYSCTIEV